MDPIVEQHPNPTARQSDAFVIQTVPKYWREADDGYRYPVFGERNGGELTATETFIVTVDPSTLP